MGYRKHPKPTSQTDEGELKSAFSLSPIAPSPQRASSALIIFAKAPIPGQVKTRLCPPLTPDEAASLHGSFVLDAIERSTFDVRRSNRYAERSRRSLEPRTSNFVDRFVACAPSTSHVFFKIMEERHGVQLLDQIGDDLGARMDQACNAIFARGYQRVLVVGTDLPTLPASFYAQALSLLSDHDLVLGPALDGGYYLIGLRRPMPDLFVEIPWSTDQVFALTLKKAEALGLKIGLLPAWRDVDTIDDLLALIEEAGLGPGHEARGARPAARGRSGTSNLEPRTSNMNPSPSPLAPSLSKRTAGVLRLLASRLHAHTSTGETKIAELNH